MNYVPDIPIWFNTKKAAQVVAFFTLKNGGQINILKVTKLIYLADRKSMQLRDHPITNDSYVSMDFGPVNSCTYNYMKGSAPDRQDQWLEYIARKNGHDIPLSRDIDIDADLDELSRSDLRILHEIWEEFKDVDRFDLAEFTHKYCPEWVDPKGSSIPIEYATIFQNLGKDNPVLLADDLQFERQYLADGFTDQ